jgi:hypothetical protein
LALDALFIAEVRPELMQVEEFITLNAEVLTPMFS